MYNEERKNQFLSSISQQEIKRFRALFTASESIEELFAKDLCEFSRAEYKFLFKTKEWNTMSSFYRRKSDIRAYDIWAFGMSFSDSADEISRVMFDDAASESAIYNRYFKDIDDLIGVLRSAYGSTVVDEFEATVSLIDVCAVYLAYYVDCDICDIMKSDINYNDNTIFHNGKIYSNIDSRCMDAFKTLGKLEIVRSSANRKLQLDNEGRVVRTVSYNGNKSRDPKTSLKNRLSVACNTIQDDDPNVSRKIRLSCVSKSGQMYRALMSEDEDPFNGQKQMQALYTQWRNTFWPDKI